MPGTVLWPPVGVQHYTLVDQIIWHFAIAHCSDLAWDNLITLQVQVDKENSMEFPLDFLHYLYNYYMVCALPSCSSHVTKSHDVTWLWLVTLWHLVTWYFLALYPCVVSPEKKYKYWLSCFAKSWHTLYFNFFLIPLLSTNPLACNWELSLPFLLACKYLFCPFHYYSHF